MRTQNIMCINEGLYYLVIWGPVLCMLCIVVQGPIEHDSGLGGAIEDLRLVGWLGTALI
jgi:hypothetical protein